MDKIRFRDLNKPLKIFVILGWIVITYVLLLASIIYTT